MRINMGSGLTANDIREAVALARGEHGQDIYIDDLNITPRGAIVFHCDSMNGRFATNSGNYGGGAGRSRAASWEAWGWLIAELYRRSPDARIGHYKDVEDFRRQCEEYGPYRERYGDTTSFLALVPADEPEPCDALDPQNRPGYGCCYRKGHSDTFPHRFIKTEG